MGVNALSTSVALEANTGAYVQVVPFNRKRTFLFLHAEEANPAMHIVIGGVVAPTDNTRALHALAGVHINFTQNAPNGPVWARSHTGATTSISVTSN